MSAGGGRRGRRGGRRERRRAEQAPEPTGDAQPARKTNGQSGPGHPVLPHPAPVAALEIEHPRPMSARAFVARLEAARAQEAAAQADEATDSAPDAESEVNDAVVATPIADAAEEPRRFRARGAEWIATIAGRGSGGTGRVAQARIEAIRFAPSDSPEQFVAEVIAPHARLDNLYDDELAELLERGLRARKEND